MKRFGLLLLLGGSLHVVNGQTYPIIISATDHPGNVYTLANTGSSRQIFSSGERVLSAQSYHVTLEGSALVEAVDDKGHSYKLALTVAKFTKTTGAVTEELLKPGTVIEVDGGRKDRFNSKEGALSKNVIDALELVYSSHVPNSPTDDDVFGTKQPRAVGESWTIDSAMAAKSVQEEAQISIPSDKVVGSVKFVSVDKLSGLDCARLEGDMKANNLKLNLDAGVKLEGDLKGVFRGCFPFKSSGNTNKSSTDMSFHFRGTMQNGAPVEGTIERRSEQVKLPPAATQ